MGGHIPRTLICGCSVEGAAVNYDGDLGKLANRLLKDLTGKLEKKGVDLEYASAWEDAELQIRFVQVEQGSQLLRYMLPFAAPAFMEIQADLASGEGPPFSKRYYHEAQGGLFGGSASGMLGKCVDRIASRIADDLADRMN